MTIFYGIIVAIHTLQIRNMATSLYRGIKREIITRSCMIDVKCIINLIHGRIDEMQCFMTQTLYALDVAEWQHKHIITTTVQSSEITQRLVIMMRMLRKKY